MRDATRQFEWALVGVLVSGVFVFAQSGQPAGLASSSAEGQSLSAVRRLSVDDVVQLVLEHNLGIRVERLNPQIQDVTIAETRTSWAPMLASNMTNTSTNSAVTSVFAGGQNQVTDSRFETSFGVSQLFQTGANYSASWTGSRLTSSNFFNTFDPQLRADLALNVTQPLVRNFKIDGVR